MVTRLVTEVLSAATRCQSVYSKTSGLAPRRFDPYPLSHGIIPIRGIPSSGRDGFCSPRRTETLSGKRRGTVDGPGRYHFVDGIFCPNDFLCGRVRIASQEYLQVIQQILILLQLDKFPLRKRANLNQRFARNFNFIKSIRTYLHGCGRNARRSLSSASHRRCLLFQEIGASAGCSAPDVYDDLAEAEERFSGTSPTASCERRRAAQGLTKVRQGSGDLHVTEAWCRPVPRATCLGCDAASRKEGSRMKLQGQVALITGGSRGIRPGHGTGVCAGRRGHRILSFG